MFNTAKAIAYLFTGVVLLTAPVVAEESNSTLEKIKRTGAVTIGYRESSVPFSYINDKGQPEGYSIDLCLRIVESLKVDLSLPNLKVNFVPVSGQTRIPLIVNGTVDLECGSTTNTLTRQQQVDYLATTFVTGSKIAVRKDSGINEVKDLKGKAVITAAGSTNERIVQDLNQTLGLNLTLTTAKDQSQGWLALETDRADAFLSDDVLLYGFISKARNPGDFKVTGKLLSFDPYAIMIRRNDSSFRLAANKALANLFRSGQAIELYNKWFQPIGVPMNPLLQASFELNALPE
jgi:glutamate/aspartate transport system substrate-binding protein